MRIPNHIAVDAHERKERTRPFKSSQEEDGMTRTCSFDSLQDDDSDSEPEERQAPPSIAKVEAIERYETTEIAAAVSEATSADDEDHCPLCLDTVTDGFRTACGHVFCAPCLADALLRNDSCPVCRRPSMHTCATPKDDCPLCVAGHKPGVVVPNVFLSEDGGRVSPFAYMSVCEIALLWCKIIAIFAVLLIAALMCVMGMLPLVAFFAVCILATMFNVFLVWFAGPLANPPSPQAWYTWCMHRLRQLMRRDPMMLPVVELEAQAPPPVLVVDRQENVVDVEAAPELN